MVIPMLKTDERTRDDSCWNTALTLERVFVLLARDEAAPHAIRAWVRKRIELGKNRPDDPQIEEALECAALMETERASVRAVVESERAHVE